MGAVAGSWTLVCSYGQGRTIVSAPSFKTWTSHTANGQFLPAPVLFWGSQRWHTAGTVTCRGTGWTSHSIWLLSFKIEKLWKLSVFSDGRKEDPWTTQPTPQSSQIFPLRHPTSGCVCRSCLYFTVEIIHDIVSMQMCIHMHSHPEKWRLQIRHMCTFWAILLTSKKQNYHGAVSAFGSNTSTSNHSHSWPFYGERWEATLSSTLGQPRFTLPSFFFLLTWKVLRQTGFFLFYTGW